MDLSLATEPFDDLDRLSPAGLEDWAGGRAAEVVGVAGAELPFYRERFAAAGFDTAPFSGLADLGRVPITRKRDILALQRDGTGGVERLGSTPGRIVTVSSGTLGTTFLSWPREWREVQGASSLRAHWWAGLRPGTPFLLVAPGWHVYAAVQSYMVERLGLPGVVVAGTYLPRFADRVVDALRRFRPRFLILFLPMVFSLLAEGRRQGRPAGDLFGSVERLVVTGAPITPGMRRHLAEITGWGGSWSWPAPARTSWRWSAATRPVSTWCPTPAGSRSWTAPGFRWPPGAGARWSTPRWCPGGPSTSATTGATWGPWIRRRVAAGCRRPG
ncbi:MAG: hypothetical protein ACRD0C_01775 [Acidimicrobiia bacterium]